MANDSSAQKPYASVTEAFFTSVETQTDMPWLNRADKPTRLTVKTTEKKLLHLKKLPILLKLPHLHHGQHMLQILC